MRWRKLESSGNVQDRRGRGRAVGAGVGGAGIIGLLVLLFSAFTGGGGGFDDLGNVLEQVEGTAPPGQDTPEEFQGIDESENFVRRVLGSTETLWEGVFVDAGQSYRPAELVLFTDATASQCGGASAAVGPHYCPVDGTVYIDLDFFGELQQRFGAGAGEFAQAYVIAHEIGHHVQNELGIMGEVQDAQRADPGNANELSVRLELQADCLAGVWAHSIYERDNVLEPGDIDQALEAAAAVGDDRIQAATTGRVTPENWTHGSAEQRVAWFQEGYRNGDVNLCDTFSGDI
jgi:predicted metalloprotease